MIGKYYNSGKDDGFSYRVERRELTELLRLLKTGQSVLVTGGRKIGKTVLLEQAKDHFLNDAASVSIPLYQDLMVLTRPVKAAPFFDALSRKVEPAVNKFLKKLKVQAKCPPPPDAWRYDPSLEFTRYLNNVLDYLDETVGRVIFIYLLDECEQLLESEETHTLLGNLRALVGPETGNRVKLVVAGFRGIKEYKDPKTGTSPFKNVLRQLPLGLLQESDFDELVQPMLKALPDENQKELRNQLWDTTGGHPCVIQTICSLLTPEKLPQGFDAACTEATKLLQDMAFSSWVERFNLEDHELFSKVLKGRGERDEKPLSVEFLQYCGVLTVGGNKLFAPCGLFNTWYERQSQTGHSVGKESGDRLEQDWTNAVSLNTDVVSGDLTHKPCALVMKGGGVKGLAYVGALRELEKHYTFNWFVGTSAGAIAAVLLAVGYTSQDLENILISTNFREFLDSSMLKLPLNLFSKGGLYEARAFTTWLDKCISKKIESIGPLELQHLPMRATVYASRRYKRALIFDKEGDNKNSAVSFAVRCSMSIPLVFTPQRDQGLRVMDGGMQNNYPVDDLLETHPGTTFIGLYLGNYYEGSPKEPSLLGDMLSIWTESVDVDAVKKYKDQTIIIDPRPISTINFNLSTKEKEFLVSVGRAAALRFLFKRGVPSGPTETEVKESEEKAAMLRAEVVAARAKRRKKRWIKVSLLLLIFILSFYLYFFGEPWR